MTFDGETPNVSVQLPAREAEILSLAARGLTDKKISEELGISRDTVSTYWRRILLRYKAANRTEVVARSIESQMTVKVKEAERLSALLRAEIAERSEAFDRLDNLLNSLDSAVMMIDDEGGIGFVNDSFCSEFMPGTKPSDLVGQLPRPLLEQFVQTFEDPDAYSARVDQIVAARVMVKGERFRMKDGREFVRDFYPMWRGDEYLGHVWKFRRA